VISEGIRLAYGVTTRSPREADEPLRYKDWVIPPKVSSNPKPQEAFYAEITNSVLQTAISEIIYFVLMDPTIFPEPDRYNPDRWLGETSLGHYLVNFGKGTRLCIGIKYVELFHFICKWVNRLKSNNCVQSSIRGTISHSCSYFP
jgi:hypothetical protein